MQNFWDRWNVISMYTIWTPTLKILFPTRWTVWAVSLFWRTMGLWWSCGDGHKTMSVTDMKARIIGVQNKMQLFGFCCGLQLAFVVLSYSDNLSSSLQRAHLWAVDAQKNAKLSVTVLRVIQSDRDASLRWIMVIQAAVKLDLQAPSLLCCHKMPSRYFEGNAQPEHHSNVEDFYHLIYFETVDTLSSCIVEHFNQKD